MSDQEKVALIIQAIQNDAKLLALLKLIVAQNIVNVQSAQLDVIISALQL